MTALNLSPPTPYYNADCSVFSNTTWVATVVGTPTNLITKLLIVTTIDKPLEYGYTAGTGATATGYFAGTPHAILLDLPAPLVTTLYVRMKAGGAAPTANTLLAISAL